MPLPKTQPSPHHPSPHASPHPALPPHQNNGASPEPALDFSRPHPVRTAWVPDPQQSHAIFPPYAMPAHPPPYGEYPDQIHSANLLQHSLPGDDHFGRRKKIDWGLINPNLEANEHVRKCDLRGEQGVYQTGFNIFTRQVCLINPQFQPLIERQFSFPNKRVHQKLLGIIWKNLTQEEQKSYKERAITVRAIGFNSERKALNDPVFKSLTQNILRIISHKKRLAQFFKGHKRYHPIEKLEHESSQDVKVFRKHEKMQHKNVIQIFHSTKNLYNGSKLCLPRLDEKNGMEEVQESPRRIKRRIPQNIELFKMSFSSEEEYSSEDEDDYLQSVERQRQNEERRKEEEEVEMDRLDAWLKQYLEYVLNDPDEEEEDQNPNTVRVLLSLDPITMKNRAFSRQCIFKAPLPLSRQEIKQRGILPDAGDAKSSENQNRVVISPGLERLRRELSPISGTNYTPSAFSPHISESPSDQQYSSSALRSSPYLKRRNMLSDSPFGSYFSKRPQDLFHSLSNQESQTLENFEPKESPIQTHMPYFNRRMFENSFDSDVRSDD